MDRSVCGAPIRGLSATADKAACPGRPRLPVPRLQLPHCDSEPGSEAGEPLAQSDAGTWTAESTPCASIDRPWHADGAAREPVGTLWCGPGSRLSATSSPAATSPAASSAGWASPPSCPKISAEAHASHAAPLPGQRHPPVALPPGVSAHVVREELLVNPRYAPLVLQVEDENLKLREALNTEKQQVLNLKVAFQTRAQAWKHELGQLEVELSEKQALEERCARSDAEIERVKAELRKARRAEVPESEAGSALRTLRELLDLFVKHIQEPIRAVRAACDELVHTAGLESTPRCPNVLGPVLPGAADSEYVERLMRVVEVLRFFAKAREEKRESDQAELSSRLLGGSGQPPQMLAGTALGPASDEDAVADRVAPGGSGLTGWVAGLLGPSEPGDQDSAPEPSEPGAPRSLDIEDVADPGLRGWMAGWRPGAARTATTSR